MKVTYKNTVKDILRFNIIRALKNPVIVGGVLIAIFFGMGSFYKSALQSGIFFTVMLFLIHILLSLFLIFIIETLLVLILIFPSKNERMLLKRIVTLTEESVISELVGVTVEYKWETLYKIEKTKHFLIFYASRTTAFLIPIRVFDDQKHFEEFYNFCKRKTKNVC